MTVSMTQGQGTQRGIITSSGQFRRGPWLTGRRRLLTGAESKVDGIQLVSCGPGQGVTVRRVCLAYLEQCGAPNQGSTKGGEALPVKTAPENMLQR